MPCAETQRTAVIAGTLTVTSDELDTMRDDFRARVLAGMDDAMRAIVIAQFGGVHPAKFGAAGSRDCDLPEIFKTLDAQFIRNLAYHGVTVDNRTAAELEDAADQRWNSQ